MPVTAQVLCITTTADAEEQRRITHVGGYADERWRITVEQAVRLVERGEWEFVVAVMGERLRLEVATGAEGTKYLRTEADGDAPSVLLTLPECP